ncbi:MAG TPA: hypothetical protein PKY56_11295 [Candidatus Kapabacteria bacterium]|nr:hypothetical protein [Candidatus Kapabacteria bacterium]HPO63947.1 hypothetical protein [Candidatus Kapabacteria bacterium]
MKIELNTEHSAEMSEFIQKYLNLYGNEETRWTVFDVNEMVELGKKIIDLIEGNNQN